MEHRSGRLSGIAGAIVVGGMAARRGGGFRARWWLVSPIGAPLHRATAAPCSVGYVGRGAY